MNNNLLSTLPETGYEMKCFIKETTLDSAHKLQEDVRNLLGVGENPKLSMNVMYLDNYNLDLNKAGWTIRVRKKSSSGKFEFTYKKRYSDVKDASDVIYTAIAEGIVLLNPNYETETDCVGKKKTLSFSNETKSAIPGLVGIDFPDVDTVIETAIKYAPVEIANIIPTDLHGYGTVFAERYVGALGQDEITVEIWEIQNEDKTGYEYIIESSFKTTDKELALSKHKEMEKLLKKNDILLESEVLKTQLVLSRY